MFGNGGLNQPTLHLHSSIEVSTIYKMFRTLKNCIQSILLYKSLKSKVLWN